MATISTDIAQNIDIIARSNDSFDMQVTITTSSGSAFDLTDYKIYMEIKGTSSSQIVKGFTNDTGTPYSDSGSLWNTSAISLTPTSGIISITESATNMDFGKGTYKYTIKLKSSSGKTKTWVYGKLKLNDN
jgi:hypothetical protein